MSKANPKLKIEFTGRASKSLHSLVIFPLPFAAPSLTKSCSLSLCLFLRQISNCSQIYSFLNSPPDFVSSFFHTVHIHLDFWQILDLSTIWTSILPTPFLRSLADLKFIISLLGIKWILRVECFQNKKGGRGSWKIWACLSEDWLKGKIFTWI